jgi:hypothetical protein
LDLACPQDPKDLGLEIAANLKSLLKIFFLYDIPKHKYLGLSGAPYSSIGALNSSNLDMTSPDSSTFGLAGPPDPRDFGLEMTVRPNYFGSGMTTKLKLKSLLKIFLKI